MPAEFAFHEVDNLERDGITSSDKQTAWKLNHRAIMILREERLIRSQEWKVRPFIGLQLLLDQPHEILLEVLIRLHPMDLLCLSRTDKRFRTLVMSYQSLWLWASTFERNPDLPPCPDDVPHPKWAELLFGAFVCEACHDVMAEPNPASRRRVCWTCEYAILSDDGLKGTDDDDDPDNNRPVWKQEHDRVQLIADKLRAKSGGYGTSISIRGLDYDTDHVVEGIASSIVQNRASFDSWAIELDSKVMEVSQKKGDRVRQVNPLRFFRHNWVTLKPRFCDALEEQQVIRKQHEQELLIQSRTHSVQELYGQKVATLLSEIQNTLPEPKDIGLYDYFTEFIHSSTLDGPLPQSDVTAKVESFIDRWPPTTSEREYHLKCVIGWQATIPHLRCVEYANMGPLELSDRGCTAAVALLDHLGLDPRTTLPAELPVDERRISVACDPCLTKRGRSPCLSWKEAIHHFAVERHGFPKWKTLSSEDINSMETLQVLDADEEVDTWSAVAGLFD
ncbi:hypothetical protein DXG01_015563 [Tephrocybe rancida]|nr:hypothetical protein DXG01_015563 [Tephrocybe rancida]